jgi:hypothetical protein
MLTQAIRAVQTDVYDRFYGLDSFAILTSGQFYGEDFFYFDSWDFSVENYRLNENN